MTGEAPLSAEHQMFLAQADLIKACAALDDAYARTEYEAHLAAGGKRAYFSDGREIFP